MNCYELYFEKEYPVPAEDETNLARLAQIFADAADRILPGKWQTDGAAGQEIKNVQLDKHLMASAEGWDETAEYVRIYYWYDTYVDFDMYEHSVGADLILFKDGRVFDLGGMWYRLLRDVIAGRSYPVGTIGRIDIRREGGETALAAELARIVNEDVQLKF